MVIKLTFIFTHTHTEQHCMSYTVTFDTVFLHTLNTAKNMLTMKLLLLCACQKDKMLCEGMEIQNKLQLTLCIYTQLLRWIIQTK